MPLAEQFKQCFEAQFREKPHPTVKLYDMKPVRIDIGKSAHARQLQGVSETYVRWYLGEYLPDISRVVYIDTDTIVQEDITKFFTMNISDNIIAAKYANYPLGKNYAESLQAVPVDLRNESVIQAGILLMDLDKWRSQNVLDALEQKSREIVAINNGSVDDQLVLSIVFHTQFGAAFFDERWNNEGPGFLGSCDWTVQEAAVLHWSGPFKAWDFPSWYPCRTFKMYKPTVACSA
jgi:lipopolysaccharide biosynthesis glycosyltransferase